MSERTRRCTVRRPTSSCFATRASEAALGTGVAGIDVGQWLGLLATFAVVYLGVGVVAFGPLLEDS